MVKDQELLAHMVLCLVFLCTKNKWKAFTIVGNEIRKEITYIRCREDRNCIKKKIKPRVLNIGSGKC